MKSSLRVSLTLLLFATLHTLSNSLSLDSTRRREILLSSTLLFPSSAYAARGAAELDLEFYVRDLVGGNSKQGNVEASKPPPAPKPRRLQLPPILDDSCSTMCWASSLLGKDMSQEVVALREKVIPSFQARAPYIQASVNDQYYFDVTAYAFWKVAATELDNYVDRDRLMRQLGAKLLKEWMPSAKEKERTLVQTIPLLKDLMNRFVESQYITNYRLGDKDGTFIDDLDDEALKMGASVDVLVSISNSCTLQACLQLTGEQSRFVPDLVSPTIAALLPGKITWEAYFVDSYRPNPKDYFPEEQLLQFTIKA